MKKWPPLFVFFLLVACGKNNVRPGITLKHIEEQSVFSRIPEVKQIDVAKKEIEIVPYPTTIQHNIYSLPDISLPDPFNSYEALFKLFPGRYFSSDGGTSLSWWKSPKTPKKKFPDWGNPWEPNEYPEVFPSYENQTEHLGTYRYNNIHGVESILYFSETTEFSNGVTHCGRICGAVLGMGLFIKDANQWVLKKFNPAIGCYGSFSGTPAPKKAKTSKGEEVFYLESANGAAGGPYYGNSFIILPNDTSYYEALVIPYTSRSNHIMEWDTELEFKSAAEEFPRVIATKKGTIDGADAFITTDWNMLPKGVKQYALHHFKFRFKETKNYKYQNGKYELMDTITEVWDKEWKIIQ
jgi:hypothetical protein